MRAAPDSKISEVKTMDEIIRAVSKDGFVKISVVTARDAVQRANAIHHCSPTAIAALGRSLCAASMLGDLLKEENGTLTLRISGGGGLGKIAINYGYYRYKYLVMVLAVKLNLYF